MKKLTLQWRMHPADRLLLAAATVSLTVLSIRNAADAFIVILEEAALVQDAIPFYGVEGRSPWMSLSFRLCPPPRPSWPSGSSISAASCSASSSPPWGRWRRTLPPGGP